MGQDWSSALYAPCQDAFGREVWINPLASQPGQPAYLARGMYNTGLQEYFADDQVVVSDQQTILDILDVEFAVLPRQGDQVTIGPDPLGMQSTPGQFEIINRSNNGGGETTLTLRKIEPAAP